MVCLYCGLIIGHGTKMFMDFVGWFSREFKCQKVTG